ncbi:hypothetical protein TWF694_007992 [Orbilia ellipsospora]|uniref:Glucose-methanol-choline oxidoreductase N-terminal domain-containing protein n=1 Tax=Orbilia ellipsospora TaxID=2528407 RepID=A0AAV9XG63_9PEZI
MRGIDLSFLVFTILVRPIASTATNRGPRNCQDTNEFDFVIVGGGTAGLALGTRLSQNLPRDCILVIEAGPAAPDEPRINIPGLKGSTLGTVYDWNITTIAQPNASNRILTQPRGKVLGGSSALNLLTWDRTSSAEYDAWEQMGNPGWNWKTMSRNMRKAETYHSTNPSYGLSRGVGKNGPIQFLVNRFIPSQQSGFLPAMKSLGVPQNQEYLDGNILGSMLHTSNIRYTNYTRSYSPSYISQAGSNLEIMTNTEVRRVIFSRKTVTRKIRATGVELTSGMVIHASKEVIISAGSLLSPIILERSGIGKRPILSSAGIETLVDLPGVGENLQDHTRIQLSFQLKPGYLGADTLRYNTTYAQEQMALYNNNKTSQYDYTGSGFAYVTWDTVSKETSTRAVQLARLAAAKLDSVDNRKKLSYLTDPHLRKTVPQVEVIFSDGYNGVKGYPAVGSPLYGQNFFALIGALMHPFSRGSVHINTTDALAKPIVNPKYLSDEYDTFAMASIAKYLRKIASTHPLKDAWVNEYEPGSALVQTDADWVQFARNSTLSIYHPVGTCVMLPLQDGGVVDSKLKVYKTENLRVVDASVFPVQIGAHIQTGVYGVAETAAEILTNDWK